MSHPGGGGRDVGQTAKLALLGLGTLATGAFGLLGLAAGYKYKKSNAPDPSKVTVQTYFDDLTHLVPPWQQSTTTTDGVDTDASASSSGGHRPGGGMDAYGFGSHRDRENEAKHPGASGRLRRQSSATELADEVKRRADLEAWELLNQPEEAALTFRYRPTDFAHVAAQIPLPMSAKTLCHVCAFLPYEGVAVLAGVCRPLNTFCQILLDHPGFQYRIARSLQGFNEVLRGPIWMRISGARKKAEAMSRPASPGAQPFYDHLLGLSIGYRETIVKQNQSAGLRSPSARDPTSPSGSPAPGFDPYEVAGLSSETRASLDTILKDVPRTMIASNPASHSLISNLDGQVEGHTPGTAAVIAALTAPPVDMQREGEAAAASSSVGPNKVLLDSQLQRSLHSLSNLLSVYALHDRELGYCQGMNFVASYLLTKLPEREAYWLFHTAMNDPTWNLREFYLNDLKGLLLAKYQFAFLFELYLPELFGHFRAQDVHSDILTEWFMTFFTFAGFPRRYPLLDRLWDCLWVTGGTKFLFRIVLSILYLSQSTLLQCEFEEILGYLKNLPDDGILNPDILLPIACDYFRVSNAALDEIEKRYQKDINESDDSRRRKEQINQKKQQQQQQQQPSPPNLAMPPPIASAPSPAITPPLPSELPPSPTLEGQPHSIS